MVRELRYRITAPGFRTLSITLVTTLLDEAVVYARGPRELYPPSWQIETHWSS